MLGIENEPYVLYPESLPVTIYLSSLSEVSFALILAYRNGVPILSSDSILAFMKKFSLAILL